MESLTPRPELENSLAIFEHMAPQRKALLASRKIGRPPPSRTAVHACFTTPQSATHAEVMSVLKLESTQAKQAAHAMRRIRIPSPCPSFRGAKYFHD